MLERADHALSSHMQLVNLVALLAAWVTVFDTIAKEREMLERPEQDVYGGMEQGVAQGIPVRSGSLPASYCCIMPRRETTASTSLLPHANLHEASSRSTAWACWSHQVPLLPINELRQPRVTGWFPPTCLSSPCVTLDSHQVFDAVIRVCRWLSQMAPPAGLDTPSCRPRKSSLRMTTSRYPMSMATSLVRSVWGKQAMRNVAAQFHVIVCSIVRCVARLQSATHRNWLNC